MDTLVLLDPFPTETLGSKKGLDLKSERSLKNGNLDPSS